MLFKRSVHKPRSLDVAYALRSGPYPLASDDAFLALEDIAQQDEYTMTRIPLSMSSRKANANFCRIGRPATLGVLYCSCKSSVLFFVLPRQLPHKAYSPWFLIDGSALLLPAASHYFFVGSPRGSTPDPLLHMGRIFVIHSNQRD